MHRLLAVSCCSTGKQEGSCVAVSADGKQRLLRVSRSILKREASLLPFTVTQDGPRVHCWLRYNDRDTGRVWSPRSLLLLGLLGWTMDEHSAQVEKGDSGSSIFRRISGFSGWTLGGGIHLPAYAPFPASLLAMLQSFVLSGKHTPNCPVARRRRHGSGWAERLYPYSPVSFPKACPHRFPGYEVGIGYCGGTWSDVPLCLDLPLHATASYHCGHTVRAALWEFCHGEHHHRPRFSLPAARVLGPLRETHEESHWHITEAALVMDLRVKSFGRAHLDSDSRVSSRSPGA